MSKRSKSLAKLRQNPRNVRYHEIETILLGLGFEKIPGKGSHTKFVLGDHVITVPFENPLKPIYIKLVLQALEELDLDDE